jgi:hypothetical protein
MTAQAEKGSAIGLARYSFRCGTMVKRIGIALISLVPEWTGRQAVVWGMTENTNLRFGKGPQIAGT